MKGLEAEEKLMDERIKILARNLVQNSCEIKPGDKVWINHIGNATEDMAKALIREVYAAGALPFEHYENPRIQREFLLHCTEEQLKLMAERDCREMKGGFPQGEGAAGLRPMPLPDSSCGAPPHRLGACQGNARPSDGLTSTVNTPAANADGIGNL